MHLTRSCNSLIKIISFQLTLCGVFHMSPWLPSLVNHPNVFNVSLTYHTDNRIFERTLVDLTCLNLTADKIFEETFIFQQIWSCLFSCAKLIHDTVQFVESSRARVLGVIKVIVMRAWNKNQKHKITSVVVWESLSFAVFEPLHFQVWIFQQGRWSVCRISSKA